MKEEGKISVWEEDVGIVKIRGSGAAMRATLTATEFLIEGAEEEGKDKTSEEWA